MENATKRAVVEAMQNANPPKRIAVYIYGDGLGCEAQQKHYINKYNHNDTVELIGFYTDVRTPRSKRLGLKKLLNDCKTKGIVEVHTKSVSRLGRNTIDALSRIKEFKAHGVAFVFESEAINTLSEMGKQLIEMLEMFSQSKMENGGAEC